MKMFKKLFVCFALTAFSLMTVNARIINIHGKVTIMGKNQPDPGVRIYDNESEPRKCLGFTDDDGRFVVQADSEGILVFESMSCKSKTLEIDGQLEINLELEPENIMLQEVTVVDKGKKKTFVMDDVELEYEGNFVKIKNYRIKIPQGIFTDERRIVVQPLIYNITRKNISYLSPVVIDGTLYAITQERMDDWDTAVDPLTPYRKIKKAHAKDKDNSVVMRDSLYLEHPNDDVAAIFIASIENYNRIVYADTFQLARGTVNPFRFLKFSLPSMTMSDEERNGRFLLNPQKELKDTEGEMNLIFPVGQSKLDTSIGDNASELAALHSELRRILDDPNSTLKSFSVHGYSSPEGNYETNTKLANARMKSAMEMILASIDSRDLRRVERSSDAEVAPWEDVVKMLRADSLYEEADQVQGVLDRYATIDARSAAMTRLPFYKSLLAETYLPKMRKVTYNIKSEFYRELTDDEIKELYVSDPTQLSKYNFYRFYSVREGDEREEALRKAMKVYPDFVQAATDLSTIMLDKGEDPLEMLKPFFKGSYNQWNSRPLAMRYNYGVAAMNNQLYSLADSVLTEIPDIPETHTAIVYCRAMVGDLSDDVIEEICSNSQLNGVLVMLKKKNNKAAWREAQKLGDSAVEWYVKAIAAHRVDDFNDEIYLEKALALDPSLIDIAKIDGDVVEMMEHIDLENLNNVLEESEENTEEDYTEK